MLNKTKKNVITDNSLYRDLLNNHTGCILILDTRVEMVSSSHVWLMADGWCFLFLNKVLNYYHYHSTYLIFANTNTNTLV